MSGTYKTCILKTVSWPLMKISMFGTGFWVDYNILGGRPSLNSRSQNKF